MRDSGETGPMNGNDRGCPGWASQLGSKSEPQSCGHAELRGGQQGLEHKDGETEAQRGTWAYWESAESGLELGLLATIQEMGFSHDWHTSHPGEGTINPAARPEAENYGLRPVFLNKVLLAHSHEHLFMYCL